MRSRLAKLFCIALLLSPAAFGRARTQGYCEQGGKTVVVSGLNGVPQVQGSYPSCNVRVFFSGLSGPVAITSISRTANVVTVVLSGPITYLLPTAIATVASVSDTTFNGSFVVSTVSSATNTFTYAQVGANTSSSGGTSAFSPVLFSDNAGTAQGNPFSASNTGLWFFYADNSRYDVQLSGGGIPTPFTVGDIIVGDPSFYFILNANNHATGQNTFDGPDTHNGADIHNGAEIHNGNEIHNGQEKFASLTSLTANPALTGFLRMATTDLICWRAFAGGSDLCLNKDNGDNLLFGTSQFDYLNVVQTFTAVKNFGVAPVFQSAPGFVMNSSQVIPNLNASLLLGATWGAPLAIGNVTPSTGAFTTLAAASLSLTGGANALFFATNTVNPAASGVFRCASSDPCLVWRNNANSGDIALAKDSSDRLTYNAQIVPAISGVVTPGDVAKFLDSSHIQDGGTASYTNGGRNLSPCTTGATNGATCTTVVSFFRTEADLLFAISCGGRGTMTGYPFVMGVTSISTTTATVTVSNGAAAQAVTSSWTEIDCTITR